MRLRTAAKMMALYHALKALTLADTDDVDKSFTVEDIHHDAVASFHHAISLSFLVHFNRHFAHEFHWRQIVLAQVPPHRTRQPRLFHEFNQADLRLVVSVFRLRLVLRDHARPRLQHGRRMHLAARIEELRHPDFFP